MNGGDIALPSRLVALGKRRTPLAGSDPAENVNDFGAFRSRKTAFGE